METVSNKSFIGYNKDDHFPIENIPFGVYSQNGENRCCTRVGNYIIDLASLTEAGHLPYCKDTFKNKYLNSFIELGKDVWGQTRQDLQTLFGNGEGSIKDNQDLQSKCMIEVEKVKMGMPIFIRDYTDFYSSKNHAYNVGVMVRGAENALQPNWTHLPIGYHGRASSIVVSGTDIRRPKGQVSEDKVTGKWSECKRMDFELEMGTVIGKSNPLGQPVKLSQAEDHIFGYCLLNDWSARDIQVWEYIPLGPFNAKNFATTISPWIITKDALRPFRKQLPKQDPEPLPYLNGDQWAYDVQLNVKLITEQTKEPEIISTSNLYHLYWSTAQQLVHHTVTGCNLNVGDLLGTGTISGTEKGTYGCLLELVWGGKEPITLKSGEQRTFLQDGDEIHLEGVCKGEDYNIGFGECRGKIIPCLSDDQYF